jgi:hypothetical protein
MVSYTAEIRGPQPVDGGANAADFREFLNRLTAQEQLIRSGHRDQALAEVDHGRQLLARAWRTLEEILREEGQRDQEGRENLRRSDARQRYSHRDREGGWRPG